MGVSRLESESRLERSFLLDRLEGGGGGGWITGWKWREKGRNGLV
jgi:hypothetical protein